VRAASCCTVWVHGIHPQRLGFFEDGVYGLVRELGKAGVEGHRKAEIEDAGTVLGARHDEQDEIHERKDLLETSLSGPEIFAAPAPCELGRAVGMRGASRWWQAARFLKDLEDYSIEKNSVEHRKFWQEMGKWIF